MLLAWEDKPGIASNAWQRGEQRANNENHKRYEVNWTFQCRLSLSRHDRYDQDDAESGAETEIEREEKEDLTRLVCL